MTHTFAELEVSAAAYDEIAGKLREAGYGHAFVDGAIDMHGIGLTRGAATEIDDALQKANSDLRVLRETGALYMDEVSKLMRRLEQDGLFSGEAVLAHVNASAHAMRQVFLKAV